MKKYIDIKESFEKSIQIPNPEENLIFCYHSFDTFYDYRSESLGNFYDYGYIKGNEVVWESEITGEFEFDINDKYDFMERVERDVIRVFSLYVNKNKKKDVKIMFNEDGFPFVIIYKDKYRFRFNF